MLNFLIVCLDDLSDFGASNCHSIVLCNPRKHFILLSLILEDGSFVFIASKPLFPEEGVSGGDYDSLSIHFSSCTAQHFPDEHHSAITDARVAYLLVLSAVSHLHILGQHVLFGYSYVPEVHVSVLFAMETKFRADIATFNSGQPVVVFVFDRYQERMYSIVFAFDDGLSKDHSMSGDKRQLSWPVFA